MGQLLRDMTFTFDISFDHEDAVWCAVCREVNAFTHGKTLEDLRDNLHDLVPLLCEELSADHAGDVRLRLMLEEHAQYAGRETAKPVAFA